MSTTEKLGADEQKLAELGYKQELNRRWSGFSNFAISFAIICILAGCFTTYGQALKNGGPIAISIVWPIVSRSDPVRRLVDVGAGLGDADRRRDLLLVIEARWRRLGLVHRLVQPDRPRRGLGLGDLRRGDVPDVHARPLRSALHLQLREGRRRARASTTPRTSSSRCSRLILLIALLVNVVRSHLVTTLYNVSVWWNIGGVLVIIVLLFAVPSHHASFSYVFSHKANASGFAGGAVSGWKFWLYILPLGFLLTMYTITGYDASAHVSEETHGAEHSAPRGIWLSVLYSAIFGWILLLGITFAIQHAHEAEYLKAGYPAVTIVETALTSAAAKAVLVISTIGQLFCSMACVTSASRMTFAFSRDGAVPGHNLWRRLGKSRTPTWSVLFVVVFALVITIPAYFPNHLGSPVAFLAVTSISVIGLYIAYTIPVYLRWRQGENFEPGPWTLGSKYKWINPIAVRLGRAVRDHLLAAVLARRRAVGKRLQLERRQLRAAGDDRGDRRRDDLVLRVGEKHLQGPDPHDRRARHRTGAAGDRRVSVGSQRLPGWGC